ncbi:hypothetical protein CLV86_1232 [Lacinutrix venerupis]|uniref:YegP family protein n=1 Tax=Lacinutrix venerupis TaxID=1486034 RepID=UPI000EAC88E9|nr:hypothetical protein [Lacinutrix venerupis]RLJ65655.1 hypothetical protein CLV86_1232 [Lacinutrix venerupis]
MAVYEIYIPKRGEFRVLLKINNEIIFVSRAYASKVQSLQAIRDLRNYSNCLSSYRKIRLECGSWCFELLEPYNKTSLGRSSTYLEESIVSKNILEMKALAPKAKLKSEALAIN